MTSNSITLPGGVSDPAGQRRPRPRVPSKRSVNGLIFSAPFLILFAAFSALPVLASLAMSFTDITSRDLRDLFGVNFVGLDNYIDVLSNERFQHAILNTAVFVLVGVPLTIIAGLALAVALNNGIRRFRTVYRVGFYTPVVTSIVAIAVVWRLILQPDGLLNVGFTLAGIEGPDWLQDPMFALPSLIAMAVWRSMGTLMVIFIAGLQDVPEQVLEAAEVDGAGAWRRFTAVTLPTLRPTILFAAVITGAGFLQFFEEPFVMTQGGPLDSTYSVSYFAYNQFGFGNLGLASASSYILFLAIVAVTLIQFRLLRSKD